MKNKSIFVVILLFLISLNLNAQILTNYGLKFGTVASNPVWKVDSQSYDGAESKMGMNVGLFLEWGLTNNISMLTEMHYIQKGLKFYEPIVENDQINNGFSVSVQSVNPNVNYLSFPVFIKYDLLSSEVIPYLIGGMRIDFALSTNNIKNPRWLYENVNNIDFGGDLGLGFQTKSLLGIGTGLEIKYSQSFIKVASSQMADITNRSFEINFILFN